jgi:hypothetical protein
METGASHHRKRNERGIEMIEFTVAFLFLVPILFGTFSVGMSGMRYIQAAVVCRDAGAMFMRDVDFTQSANQAMLVRIAHGMGLQQTGGNGVVILSQVMLIGDNECQAGGYQPANCPNNGQTVFIKRVVVGNSTLHQSTFGTPPSGLLQSDGTISKANYLAAAGVRANNFTNILQLDAGKFGFLSEVFFRTPELNIPGFRDNSSVYLRNIF